MDLIMNMNMNNYDIINDSYIELNNINRWHLVQADSEIY